MLSVFVVLLVTASLILLKLFFNPLGLGPIPREKILGDDFFETAEKQLDEFRLLIDGEEAFGVILDLLGKARESIVMQTFTWRDDHIGALMADTLIRAADRGVKVSINKDGVGTVFEFGDILRGRPGPVFANKKLKAHPNISISASLFKDTDHSKYFIVDNRHVVFGGMNIADEHYKRWSDYMVWINSERLTLAFSDKVLRSINPVGERSLRFAVNDRVSTQIRAGYLEAITQADKSILLEHAYFSDPKIIDALIGATWRDVNVTVVLPEFPDTHKHANMVTVNKLVNDCKNERLNIYLLPDMTHAKVGLIDESIIIIGSANLTIRSMVTSREVVLFVHVKPDDPFISRLRERINEDIKAGDRVSGSVNLSVLERFRAFAGKYVW